MAQGPVPELPPEELAKMERTRDAVLWQRDHMHELPALVIACGEFLAPIENPALGAGQVWPAVQNFLLAARALGLGATPTTLGLTPRSASRAILELPDNVEAYVLIPVGYPMGRFGPVKRLPVGDTVRWDRWT
jgi:nitroreductase